MSINTVEQNISQIKAFLEILSKDLDIHELSNIEIFKHNDYKNYRVMLNMNFSRNIIDKVVHNYFNSYNLARSCAIENRKNVENLKTKSINQAKIKHLILKRKRGLS